VLFLCLQVSRRLCVIGDSPAGQITPIKRAFKIDQFYIKTKTLLNGCGGHRFSLLVRCLDLSEQKSRTGHGFLFQCL
jgi:hypothetical protein